MQTETKAFDPSKPVQTRDGKEAGIYATDGAGDYPILGYVNNDGGKRLERWTLNGECQIGFEDVKDLVNTPDPTLPEVEGGRLEYRPHGWTNEGKETHFFVYNEGPRVWEECGVRVPTGTAQHYAEFIPDECNHEWNQTFEAGMTIRDWFAGQALIGILSGQERDSGRANLSETPIEVYAIADAMIEARKGKDQS